MGLIVMTKYPQLGREVLSCQTSTLVISNMTEKRRDAIERLEIIDWGLYRHIPRPIDT